MILKKKAEFEKLDKKILNHNEVELKKQLEREYYRKKVKNALFS